MIDESRAVSYLPSFAFCLFTFAFLLLSAPDFDLGFERDDEVADARLVNRLDEAQGLVQHAALVFGPVGLAGDAAELAWVVGRARGPGALDRLAFDGEHHRGDARRLDGARDERHRLVAEARGRDQK